MDKDRLDTKAALIQAGLALFGARGYDAVSVRDLVAESGANIAAISYHFGGKEGLRRACAQAVVSRIAQAMGGGDLPEQPLPDFMAQDLLEEMISGSVRALVADPDAAPVAHFILREVMPDPVLTDLVYVGLFDKLHARICALWSMATGAVLDSETTHLRMFTLIGQVTYFRIAQPVVTRRMGWSGIGEEESEAIRRAVTANLRAMILVERAGGVCARGAGQAGLPGG